MKKIYQKRIPLTASSSNAHLRGFTLIELLVVVLIIGILAAVAVPQYQKAVFKSCATEGYLLFEKLKQAQELYKMENGNYSRDRDNLILSFPRGNSSYYDIVFCNNSACGVRLTERPCSMVWEYNWNTPSNKAVSLCLVYKNSVQEYVKQFCQEKGYVYYYTSEAGTLYYILPN